MDDGDDGGCYSCTQLPDPTPDPDDDDDDNNNNNNNPTQPEDDIVGGSKPQYSPTQIDGFCTEYADGGYGCGYMVTKEEAEKILSQLRSDQIATIGAWAAMGAIIGFVAGGVLSGGNPAVALGIAVVGGVLGSVGGAISSSGYQDAYDEIRTASDNTPQGEKILIQIGRQNSSSPIQMQASGYDSIDITYAALESIINATGIDVLHYYSPNSTPMP
jgi:hypothetical protein